MIDILENYLFNLNSYFIKNNEFKRDINLLLLKS